MGKLGVGIGDDFPVEDGNNNQGAGPNPGNDSPRDAEYEKRREDYRKAREAWREQRQKMRDAWRERRRAFREEMRARYGDAYDHDWHGATWHGPYRGYASRHLFHFLLIGGLIVLGIAILSHIYILFGLVVLAGLYYAYRGGFDHFDYPVPPRANSSGSPPEPNKS